MEKSIENKIGGVKWLKHAFEWIKVGGGLALIATVLFMSGIFVKESWDNTKKIDAVEARLGNIEKSIADLTNKITEWQHQAKRNNDLFERYENKVWEMAPGK